MCTVHTLSPQSQWRDFSRGRASADRLPAPAPDCFTPSVALRVNLSERHTDNGAVVEPRSDDVCTLPSVAGAAFLATAGCRRVTGQQCNYILRES